MTPLSTPAQPPAAIRGRLPGAGAVFRAHLALLAAPPWRAVGLALVLVVVQALALAAGGVLFGVSIHVDEEVEERTFTLWTDLDEVRPDAPFDRGLAAVVFLIVAANAWGFFWPWRVWRDEPPSRRGYHAAMPVELGVHELLRGAAGAVSLLAVVAGLAAVTVAAAAASGHAAALAGLPAAVWLHLFLAPLVPYLAVAAAVVARERAAAWVWGAIGAFVVAWTVADAAGGGAPLALLDGVARGRLGLFTAQTGGLRFAETHPAFAGAPAALALWLALAAAAFVLAARRAARR